MRLATGLVYASVDGPRYETAAEIRMFGLLGADVVGMTGAPEAILANELGLRYASIVVGTNRAAGLQDRISHDEVVADDEPDFSSHQGASWSGRSRAPNRILIMVGGPDERT